MFGGGVGRIDSVIAATLFWLRTSRTFEQKVPALVALCAFSFRGLELIGGLVSLGAASVGGYLLVVDASVKAYRDKIRGEHAAIRETLSRKSMRYHPAAGAAT